MSRIAVTFREAPLTAPDALMNVPSALAPAPVASDASEEDLLLYMACEDTDPALALAAWGVFFQRHAGWLAGQIGRTLRPRNVSPEDLAQDALVRAYKSAGTFRVHEQQGPDRLRWSVRAWLARIAERIYLDFLAEHVVEHPYADPYDAEGADLPEPDDVDEPPEPAPFSLRHRLVLEAFEHELSEREAAVLRTYYAYHRPGQEHQRLPQRASDALVAEFDTTPANVRQIKARAQKRVEAYVNARLPDSERPK